MTKQIKVIYIISSLSNKGPTNILYSIINDLDREKFLPLIFTLKPETNNSRFDEFKSLNIKIISSNSKLEGKHTITNRI